MLVTIKWKRNAEPLVTSIVNPSEALKYMNGLLENHAADIEDWSITGNLPVEVRLANVDTVRNGMDFTVKLFNKDDKQVAVIKTDAVKLQEFAVRVLNQTTYSFTDAVDK